MPLAWSKRVLASVLRQGAVPAHVAFIMDGNRRYAASGGLERIDGHRMGYEKLVEVLEFCLLLGVKTVSAFAFSIENFRRSSEQVAELMRLAVEKLNHMCGKGDIIERHRVRVQILGEMHLLDAFPDVQRAMSRVVELSRDNDGVVLNIAFAYTGRQDVLNAAQTLADLGADGTLLDSDVDEGSLSEALHTFDVGDPQLVVRTSGEVRLSDFFLWQGRYAYLGFLGTNWPQMSLWRFAVLLLQYQRAACDVRAAQEHAVCLSPDRDGGAGTVPAGVSAAAPMFGALHERTRARVRARTAALRHNVWSAIRAHVAAAGRDAATAAGPSSPSSRP